MKTLYGKFVLLPAFGLLLTAANSNFCSSSVSNHGLPIGAGSCPVLYRTSQSLTVLRPGHALPYFRYITCSCYQGQQAQQGTCGKKKERNGASWCEAHTVSSGLTTIHSKGSPSSYENNVDASGTHPLSLHAHDLLHRSAPQIYPSYRIAKEIVHVGY